RGLGQVTTTGLTELAQQLAQGDAVDRLAAAALLARQGSGPSEQALRGALASDGSPAVAAAMRAEFLALSPEALAPLSPAAATSPDPRLRELAARALAVQADPAAIALLASMLNDPHPQVRGVARDALLAFNEVESLKTPLREEVMRTLAGESWQG